MQFSELFEEAVKEAKEQVRNNYSLTVPDALSEKPSGSTSLGPIPSNAEAGSYFIESGLFYSLPTFCISYIKDFVDLKASKTM
mgnify:CR=1 FL=1